MRRLLIVWFAWLSLMAGANLATPLYHVYAARFHFSPLVLTAIFATYAVVLVPALVLFGRLSDRFGRRPVIVAGLATACLGLCLFAVADSEAWLFAARAVQGLAVGMISGAATAALVELDPDDDRRRAALGAGLAQAGGSALGPLLAGMLAEWAPDPLRLTFLVMLGVTVVAGGLVLRLPAQRDDSPEPWRPQWPRVPSEIRHPFLRVAVTAGAVWATLALFLSIVPSYAAALLQTHNLALVAVVATVALAASFAAQAVAARRQGSRRRDQALGCVLVALGLAALVGAAPAGSLALLVVGGLVAGAGHGVAFLEAQQELNDLAPDERRGEVTAAFISCIYLFVAAFVVASGLLALRFSLDASVESVSVVLLAVALAAAGWHAVAAFGRPTRRRSARPHAAAHR